LLGHQIFILDEGEVVDNDKIASAIYIVLEQFDRAADKVASCKHLMHSSLEQRQM